MSLFAQGNSNDHSSGSVWSGGLSIFNTISTLTNLLEQGEFTLEELLEEDELIQEVRARNEKLIEFLASEDAVHQMIVYVTQPANKEDSVNRQIKYPYVACEVFSCDVYEITETLVNFENGKLLEELFEALNPPNGQAIDARLAGYFQKIISLLFIRRPGELISVMNRNDKQFLQAFVKNLESYSITELFKRLLQPAGRDPYADNSEMMMGMGMGMNMGMGLGMGFGLGQDFNPLENIGRDSEMSTPGTPKADAPPELTWLEDPSVIDSLVGCLSDNGDENGDIHEHASDILVDLAQRGVASEEYDAAGKKLTDFLERRETIAALLNIALPVGQACVCASSMTGAIIFLKALLLRHANSQYSTTAQEEQVPLVISGLLQHIPQLCKTLKAEDHSPGTVRNQLHKDVPRLGVRRLKLVGLVGVLIQSKYHCVDIAVAEHDILSICFDLMLQHEQSNFLHSEVENIIASALVHGSVVLRDTLLLKTNLFKRILQLLEQVEKDEEHTRGYMGHIYRILNAIDFVHTSAHETLDGGEGELNEMTEADKIVEQFESNPSWKELKQVLQTTLKDVNQRENVILGGTLPKTMDSMHEESYESYVVSSQFAGMLGFGLVNNEDGDLGVMQEDEEMEQDTTTKTLPSLPELDDSSSSDEEEFFNFRAQSANATPPAAPEMLDESSRAMEAADELMAGNGAQGGDNAEENWADFGSDEAMEKK